jgi:hypothetical protein
MFMLQLRSYKEWHHFLMFFGTYLFVGNNNNRFPGSGQKWRCAMSTRTKFERQRAWVSYTRGPEALNFEELQCVDHAD